MKTFKRMLQALPALLLACVLVLTGCQNSAENEHSGEKEVETTTTADSSGETEENAEEEEIYADKLWDRSLTKGKFAIYVMRVNNPYPTDSLVSHPGDSILLISPDGKTMMIDLNTPTNSAVIVDSLQKLGIKKLDYLVFSHQHIDHIGGISNLLRYIEVDQVLTNSHENTGSGPYRSLHKLLDEHNIPVRYAYEGDSFMLGNEVQVKIYNPPVGFDYKGGTAGQNNGSLLMKFIYKESSFLTGGDLYASQEGEVLRKYADELHVGVAKMNHHGYDTSNTKEWIKAVSPKIAFAQMTGVTSDVVIARYQARGAATFHTALDGPFVIYTDGDDTYEVQVSRERWSENFGQNDMEKGYMVVK